MPDYCFGGTPSLNPYQSVDFIVKWNPSESSTDLNTDASTQTEYDEAICLQSNSYDSTIPSNSNFSSRGNASTNLIVGVSVNGVPLYSGVTATNTDMIYPQVWNQMGTFSFPDTLDSCLGATDSSQLYHYRILPPCIKNISARINSASTCKSRSDCSGNVLSYAQNYFGLNSTKGQSEYTILGIAKDGHLIYSPITLNQKLLACSKLDMCNGKKLKDGTYAYFMTESFPYTVACWGPGKSQKYTPSCTVNACFSILSFEINFIAIAFFVVVSILY